MIGRIIGAIIGGAISLASGYGIYRLIDMIITGASSANWLMVIAGGILAYLFIGLLILGVFTGGAILLLSLTD